MDTHIVLTTNCTYTQPTPILMLPKLPNPIQTRPVDRNAIIHLVRLLNNALNVSVLAFDLRTHSLTKFPQRSRAAMDSIPNNKN